MNELDLFAAAIAIAEPAERNALLDRECSGRPELRKRLGLLLDEHARSHHLLDRRNGADQYNETALMPGQSLTGKIIAGRYKLLEQIGDGGMGTVWRAEQREPVKRLVAVKLIKAGMDSKAVLARFEAERQALALMDHPNIAKIHDAGTDENGRPYFVMELVKGLPLTEYCDTRKLTVDERLHLFVQICSAVQHAHQKAVIHRDLKPSNVLVTEHDGKPVPKVIDFGLAKALNSSQMLTDQTLYTAHGTVVGTPLYMAPEQVGINALDVDTRADIYALGVILYELLTGTTPLERARFKEAAWEEVKRLICEEEPPRPSMRLSSDHTLPSLAASRQVDPGQLRRQVQGELDWIVMKALDKDRGRRYATATGLANDVLRYLSGETVEACPPTLSYRLRKTYRKHRAAVLTTLSVAAMMMTATGVSLAFGILARRAELQAKEEAAVASFLLDTFLGSPDDEQRIAVGNVPFKTVLDRAIKHLNQDRQRSPLVVARIRGRIGRAYLTLGQYADSQEQLESALDVLQRELGHSDLETLFYQEDFIYALQAWDAETEAMLRDVLKRRRAVQGPDHPDTIRTLVAIGGMRYKNQDMAEAENIYREALRLAITAHGNESRVAIRCKLTLASHVHRKGKQQEAAQLVTDAAKSASETLGHDDPLLLYVRQNAIRYQTQRTASHEDNRELAEAAEALLPAFIDTYGEDHPRTLALLDDVALHYNFGEMFEEADPYSQDLLQKRRQLFGPEAQDTVRSMWIRGESLRGLKRLDEAKTLYEEALALLREKGERKTQLRGSMLVGLGECLLEEGQLVSAEERLTEGYHNTRSFFEGEGMSPNRRQKVVRILNELIQISQKLGKEEEEEHWRNQLKELPP